jgi:hypothetical protein
MQPFVEERHFKHTRRHLPVRVDVLGERDVTPSGMIRSVSMEGFLSPLAPALTPLSLGGGGGSSRQYAGGGAHGNTLARRPDAHRDSQLGGRFGASKL